MNPIRYIDPDGKEIWILVGGGKSKLEAYQYKDGKLYSPSGAEYKGNNSYARAVQNDLNKLSKDNPVLEKRLRTMQKSDKLHGIMMPVNNEGNSNSAKGSDLLNGVKTNSLTQYDPNNTISPMGEKREPRIGLGHELLGHGWDADQGTFDNSKTSTGIPMSEVNAVNTENAVRKSLGLKLKDTYGGNKIPKKQLKSIE